MAHASELAQPPAGPSLRLVGPRPPSERVPIHARPELGPDRHSPLLSLGVRAFILDLGILSTSVAIYAWAMEQSGYLSRGLEIPLIGTGLVVCWLAAILARGGYDERHLGIGSEEFKRVVSATTTVLATIGVVAYILPIAPPLRVVLPSLVMGLMLILLGRWWMRAWLRRQRWAGRFQQSTLIVGERMVSASLAEVFGADSAAGFRVIGSVQPPRGVGPHSVDVWLDDVMDWIAEHAVDAVAVVESTNVDVDLLRRLSWRLEGPRVDLLVTPVLSDVAGPRLSVRPAAGLPLLHLDEPSLTGPKRMLKRMLDLLLTVPALVVLAPLFLLVAFAIKLDSPGGVFYVSPRVGRAGEVFGCLKFRSMSAGADKLRAEVIGVPDDEIAARYRGDPRITRVGRILRRWSLDELPQLLNVVGGSMSLVGPRPMLPEEMDLLGEPDHRRHLTKPGITGLWQVSGRKEVAWDDRMRMDLRYLENWSIALDVVILAKTLKAVLSGHGAY